MTFKNFLSRVRVSTNVDKLQLIGTTSWLIPATYYENAKLVAGYVNFVELLVYKWDVSTKEIFDDEISKLAELTYKHNLYYTIHLPVDSFEEVENAYNYFNSVPLNIINYVLHPLEDERFKSFVESKPNVAVENLSEKVYEHTKNVFDVGHFLLGRPVSSLFIQNAIEIHLMGVDNGKDHLPLNENTLDTIYNIIGNRLFEIPLICFEVFDIDSLVESIKLWRNWNPQRLVEK